jgi:hypothetical protein
MSPIIQHLSPDYKSLMAELLSKRTEIPVHRAENGMQVMADAIYLIPPKKELTIFHGRLILGDAERLSSRPEDVRLGQPDRSPSPRTRPWGVQHAPIDFTVDTPSARYYISK